MMIFMGNKIIIGCKMKKNILIALMSLVLFVSAQEVVEYTYDDAGNRIEKTKCA